MKSFQILAFLILFLVGCGGKPERPSWPVPVVLYETRPESVDEAVQFVGTLAANEAIDVQSEIAGKVEKVHFDEGQSVSAGDVLLELETKKLRADVARSEANFNLARANMRRSRELLKRRTISQQEYDQSMAQFEADKAELERVRQLLDEAIIEAPFDGVVGARLESPGQFIDAGTKLTSLVSLQPMKLEVEIPERYLARLRVGLVLSMKVVAYPSEEFAAEVYFVSPEVDVDTRTALVKAKVDNPKNLLRPGMFAEVDLVFETRKDAVVIPESALMISTDSTNVFLATPEKKVEIRKVVVGTRLSDRVEITEGLKPGEFVIVKGIQKVRPGSNIIPAQESDLVRKDIFQGGDKA